MSESICISKPSMTNVLGPTMRSTFTPRFKDTNKTSWKTTLRVCIVLFRIQIAIITTMVALLKLLPLQSKGISDRNLVTQFCTTSTCIQNTASMHCPPMLATTLSELRAIRSFQFRATQTTGT
jgi:hypothetical protein